MTVPNEATTNFPSDAASKKEVGLWDAENGYYWAPRTSYGVALLASAGRTTTTASALVSHGTARGCTLILNVTGVGTGFLNLQVIGSKTGQTWIVASAAVQASGGAAKYVLDVYPGASGNSADSGSLARVSSPIPRDIFGRVDHGSASGTWTYQLDLVWEV